MPINQVIKRRIVGSERDFEFQVAVVDHKTSYTQFCDVEIGELSFEGTYEKHPEVHYRDGNADQEEVDVSVWVTNDPVQMFKEVQRCLLDQGDGLALAETPGSVCVLVNQKLEGWVEGRVDDYLDEEESY